MDVNKKGAEVGQLFSLKTALNISEKRFVMPKTISDCRRWKTLNILCLQGFNLAPKVSRPPHVTRSSVVGRRSSVVGRRSSVVARRSSLVEYRWVDK